MEVFLGTICAFAFKVPPNDWAPCEGQLLNVAQFGTLYSLIKNTYGGDNTKFNLPDLTGRAAMGMSSNYKIGSKKDAVKSITLDSNTMPAHTHDVTIAIQSTKTPPSSSDPANNYPAPIVQGNIYTVSPEDGKFLKYQPTIVLKPVGAQKAIDVTKAYLPLNYCMCMHGDFPQRG